LLQVGLVANPKHVAALVCRLDCPGWSSHLEMATSACRQTLEEHAGLAGHF